ncbi:MAG: trypsin-like peptidase domain-containing protein [Elusimicrobiota bacterium]
MRVAGDAQFKVLVFRACLAAVWSDQAMSADERRHLLGLIEQLGGDEAERQLLRREALKEVKPAIVLSEIESLDEEGKRRVFEECLAVLKSDRALQKPDFRFLGRLRKACGIGLWEYWARLARLARFEKVKVIRWKPILGLGVCAAVLAGLAYLGAQPGTEYPEESSTAREILIAPPGPGREGLPAAHEAEWVYRLARDSVVTVDVLVDGKEIGGGSGSVIGLDRAGVAYVLTNKHVVYKRVKRGRRIGYRVQRRSGPGLDARLDFHSRKHDLAILSVDWADRPARPLPLSLRGEMEVGQPVYALGSPMGLKHSFTAGVVSALRDDYLQTDATTASGSSGGPLVDAYGRLCGVMTKSHTAKDYSFALYADAVLDALRERRDLYVPAR